MFYHACVKGCRHKWRRTPNLGSAGAQAPSRMCYHVEFGRFASKGIQGNSKVWGRWGFAPCNGNVSNPIKRVPSPYMLTRRIGSFCVKRSRRKYREPQKLGSAGTPPLWDEGVADPLVIRPPPRVLQLQILFVLGQTVRAWMRRFARNIWPSRPAFQGNSRSSEPTRIDRWPITSYSHPIKCHSSWNLWKTALILVTFWENTNRKKVKVKVAHGYSATYNPGQRRFTTSEVAADWHWL